MRISTFFLYVETGRNQHFPEQAVFPLLPLRRFLPVCFCSDFLCGHFKLPERRAHGRRGRFCYRIF